MSSALSMLATGTVVGVVHAFEADHLAAVASLVEDEDGASAGLVGTSWGIGHVLPIAAVGLALVLVGSRLPDGVGLAAEALAGVVLVLLGARVAWSALETTRHTHDGHTHTHLSLGSFEIGTTHSHRRGESFLVGVLHGLAGSGVAVGALATDAAAATEATLPQVASLLVGFALASILTMGVLALLWGSVLSRTAGRVLQVGAGAVAVVVGSSMLFGEVLGIEALALPL